MNYPNVLWILLHWWDDWLVLWTGTVMGCGVTKSNHLHKHTTSSGRGDTHTLTYMVDDQSRWLQKFYSFLFFLILALTCCLCVCPLVFLFSLLPAAVTSKPHLLDLFLSCWCFCLADVGHKLRPLVSGSRWKYFYYKLQIGCSFNWKVEKVNTCICFWWWF